MMTKCLAPQFVKRPGGGERILPCGKCYNCRRKLVRKRQGQAVCEQRFPYYPEHGDPLCQHFLTFTYKKTPMTIPRPHKLGKIVDSDGNEIGDFAGPFQKRDPNARDAKSREGIEKRSGRPCWAATGDPLTPAEIEEQHERYFLDRLGWSPQMLRNWETGNYDPEPTTRVKDIQMFIDRLRKRHSRSAGAESPLRYMFATEYGGVTERPHWHLLLWGLHHDNIEWVYKYWEDYQEGYGFVDPTLFDAKVNMKTVMGGRAATYQAKDLAKSRHEFVGTPGMYEVERPRVDGSRNPPIGDGAYSYWMETWIGKVIQKAENLPLRPGVDREEFVTRMVLDNYAILHVPIPNSRPQTFPTTRKWRERCRADLGISDENWEKALLAVEAEEQEKARLIRDNVDGLGDEHVEYLEELRDRNEETQRRERDRIEAKRAKLIAAGKLQSNAGG